MSKTVKNSRTLLAYLDILHIIGVKGIFHVYWLGAVQQHFLLTQLREGETGKSGNFPAVP
jgi:hypothetical protein